MNRGVKPQQSNFTPGNREARREVSRVFLGRSMWKNKMGGRKTQVCGTGYLLSKQKATNWGMAHRDMSRIAACGDHSPPITQTAVSKLESGPDVLPLPCILRLRPEDHRSRPAWNIW